MHLSRILTAGSLVVIASLAPVRSDAQSIASRIASARDGKVRMTYASRDEICGYGNGISTKPGNQNQWSSDRNSPDVVYDNVCGYGPVRLVAEIRDGKPERIRAYVGGRWREPVGRVTDLGSVSVREATAYLLDLARTQPGKVGGEAIFAATLADSVEMVQPLYDIARNDSHPRETRDQAIFWMSQIDDDRVVGNLEKLLRGSRDEHIQDKAIFGLSQTNDDRARAVLREFAENDGPSDKVRGSAIFWLGQSRSGESPQYLRSLYSRVKSSNLKDKVIFSVAQQRGSDSEKWLLDLVRNESEPIEMRKKALFWAGQEGASISSLSSLYSGMRSNEMKEQMVFVLSQKRETAAVEKLMDIARNDPDRSIRRKALFWLGQSKDPRVMAMLTDMITK